MTDQEAMNTNDLVYKIAARVKELADQPVGLLRAIAPSNCDTRAEAVREHRHETRASLIEMIIVEEFIEEFPKEIV